jgi:hypothetical protein
MPDLPLPDLKPLHGSPALFVMALGYVLLVAAVVFLTNQRAVYFDKEREDLTKLLQTCMDKKDPVGAKSRILTPKTGLSTGLGAFSEPFSSK